MKFVRLRTTLSHAIGRFIPRNANASWGSTCCSYSTAPATPSRQRVIGRTPRQTPTEELYRRISPVGDPNVSIVPILDQWIEEGRALDKDQLLYFIRELRYYKRFAHALEISFWMTDKRYFYLTPSDVAIRLDLITKVHGLEQAENYLNNISQQLKGIEVYSALLNCYAKINSVEKAEATLQRMKELGLVKSSLVYNSMLTIYYRTENIQKLEALLQEMDKNHINYDKFTYCIVLNAYASVSDIERMEKTMARMEADPIVDLDWATYNAVASGYRKAGLLGKAFEMLKKSERLIYKTKRHGAYGFLLTHYAAIGKKDEVLRLWELYKKQGNVVNVGYMSMIAALLKLDDLESAEKVFEDWESQNLTFDLRIPNFLIGAYTRKGLLEKAESLVNKVISKAGEPNAFTWYYLATGYLENNQIPKGVEMMKKSIQASKFSPRWKPHPKSLVACLQYLKEEDPEKAEEFIALLRNNELVSLGIGNRLLNSIRKDGAEISESFNDPVLCGDSLYENSDSAMIRLVEPHEVNSDCISSIVTMQETHLNTSAA